MRSIRTVAPPLTGRDALYNSPIHGPLSDQYCPGHASHDPGVEANLVGGAHASIEDVQGDADQGRVRHPGAVVAVAHLPVLVRLHLRSMLMSDSLMAPPAEDGWPAASQLLLALCMDGTRNVSGDDFRQELTYEPTPIQMTSADMR